MKIAPHPLCWPPGWPRTEAKDRLVYLGGGNTPPWNNTLARLTRELRLLDGSGFCLSSNRPLRSDGQPYADPGINEDPGVAVYFTRKGTQLVLAQDLYEIMNNNVRSLCLAFEGPATA